MNLIAYESRPFLGFDFYETEFDAVEYWGGSLAMSVSNGVLISPSPWPEDDNHDVGIGRLSLVAYRDKQGWETETAPGVFVGTDATYARIRMRMRMLNANLQGGTFLPWVQARNPDDPTKFPNWAYTGVPLNAYCDGSWHDLDFDLVPDPALWTFAGGAKAEYATSIPVGLALRNLHNLHFPVVRAVGSPPASGQLEIERFKITYLRRQMQAAEPPSEGETLVLDPPLAVVSFGNEGHSFRAVGKPLQASCTQVRAKFRAVGGPAGAKHAAIGIQADGPNTFGTPVEFKWSGASGFALAAGQETPWSDWANLTMLPGDTPVTIFDSSTSTQARTAGSFAGGTFYKYATDSYDSAAPNGPWNSTGLYFGAALEVRW
jgi:hypothetical protein